MCITGYQCLESLLLALVVGLGGRDGKLLTDLDSGHVFAEARKRFLEVLLHIRSTVMTTITLRLAPFLVPLTDGSWQFTYRSTRLEAIHLMFGSATRELLTSWPLETLKVLYIHIQDSSSAHNASWWRQAISDQLGRVPCDITVYVDHCEYIYFVIWFPILTGLAFGAVTDDETRLRGNYRYDKVWLDEECS